MYSLHPEGGGGNGLDVLVAVGITHWAQVELWIMASLKDYVPEHHKPKCSLISNKTVLRNLIQEFVEPQPLASPSDHIENRKPYLI